MEAGEQRESAMRSRWAGLSLVGLYEIGVKNIDLYFR